MSAPAPTVSWARFAAVSDARVVAEDAVARVRALHQTWNAILFGEEPRGTCSACVEAYPCATIRALDGES